METSRALLSRRSVLLAGVAAATAAPAWSQGNTQSSVRLVVPFTPGTGIDIVARQIAGPLTERLGRSFYVENKAGASGNIGTQEVVRATPDGSTLLVSVNTLVMNRALYPHLTFDPVKDLAAISLTSWGQLLLVANPKLGVHSAKELVALAKSKPGRLTYASPGAGTPHHLAMELLKKQAGISLLHVPYRGTGPAVTDLVGGQVDLMFLPIHVALPQVRAGKLEALAISSDKANPLLPQVPPLKSLNMGDLNVDMWYGVLAPKATPRAFIDRVNRELKDILAAPALASAFEAQGMTPGHSSPEEFQQLMEKDAARWADLIKAQKITAE